MPRKSGKQNPTALFRRKALSPPDLHWGQLDAVLNEYCPGHGPDIRLRVASKLGWLSGRIPYATYGPTPEDRVRYCRRVARDARRLVALIEGEKVLDSAGKQVEALDRERAKTHPGFYDMVHAAGDDFRPIAEASEIIEKLADAAEKAASSLVRQRLSFDDEIVSVAEIVIAIPAKQKPAMKRKPDGETLSPNQVLLDLLLTFVGLRRSKSSLAKYLAKAVKRSKAKK